MYGDVTVEDKIPLEVVQFHILAYKFVCSHF